MSMQLHHTLMSQYKHGTASGTGSVSYESVANCVTPEIVIYGKCVQNGTPTPDAPVDIIANNNVYSVNGSYYNIPTLYAVGNVRDEYYLLSGKIIRRCGVKEVKAEWQYPPDGSPSLETLGKSFCFGLPTGAVGYQTSICSHFENVDNAWLGNYKGRYGIYSDHPTVTARYFRAPNESITTVAEFKTWLDEQKAAGTPVTLVYVRAEPVIEYVDPVQITSVRGTNIIEETDLNYNMFGIPFVEGTQIDVKYLTHS